MRARKSTRKIPTPPPDVKAFIKRIEDAKDDELVQVLEPVQIWRFARGDMNSWTSVIKRFNGILERVCTDYGLGERSGSTAKFQQKDFSSSDKQLTLVILRFVRLLMENCTSRKTFDGYEYINDILLTKDLDVLEAALYLLLRPLQQYLTQLPTGYDLGISLRARLQALAGGWETFHALGCSLSNYASATESFNFSNKDVELQFSFYPNTDAASLQAEVSTSPVKPAHQALSAPSVETPTRPSVAASRAEQRAPTTPAAKATVHPVDNSMLTINFGTVGDMMSGDWLAKLAETTKDRMDIQSQFTFLNKARVLIRTESEGLETRRKLLTCRLLALSCYLFFCDDDIAQQYIFQREPDLMGEVAELLIHDRDVGDDVLAAAITAMDAASRHKSDYLNHINVNVSHGIIMSLLRSVVSKLVAGEYVAHDVVDALFAFLSSINSMPLQGNQLIGAGLIPLLLEMFKTKGDRRGQYIPRACGLIDSAYFTHPQALQAFNNADGINVYVTRIKEEVQAISAAPIAQAEGVFDRDSMITWVTNPVKSELRSIYRMLQSTGGSDGFRNVVDTDLPRSLKLIFTEQEKFGLRVLTLAINIMSTIVHNEPTALQILQEAQLPQTLYQVLETSMPESFELVYALPNAIGAICLNQPGLDDTIAHFGVVVNVLKAAISWSTDETADRDHVQLIGTSLDELVRHHPALRPKVREAIITLFKDAIKEGQDFKPPADEVNDYAVAPSAVDTSMAVDKDKDDKEERDVPTNAPLSKITNILKILSGLLRNSNMCKEFISEGGLDLILNLADLPCIPVRFTHTEAALAIPQVLRAIGEHDQVQLTERMVESVRSDLESLPEIWSQKDNTYEAWLGMTKEDGTPADIQRLRGTAGLALRLSFLSEWLSLNFGSQRTISSVIKALGVSSGSNFVTDLGQLHRVCLQEHVFFKELGARDAAKYASEQEKKTAAEGGEEATTSTAGAEETAPGPSSSTETPMTEIVTGDLSPRPAADTPVAAVASEKRPPTRVQTVRTLATRLHAILTRFFKSLARLVFNKRIPDESHKKEATALADCIAEIIIGHLQSSAQVPQKAFAIDTVSLGLAVMLLFDDRGVDGHISTTLFIPFEQKGGLAVLLDNVRRIIYGTKRIQDIPPEADRNEEQKEEHAQISQGIRIATMVLAALASPHSLLESPQTHVIEQREHNLPISKRFSAVNTFVRIRRDIFPISQQLWQAEWLPLLARTTMRVAVSTFLEIMEGKTEEMEVTIGTMPSTTEPLLREMERLRAQVPRPPLAADVTRVTQLVEMGFGRRSAERALVRARNNVANATDLLLSMPHLFPNEASPDATPAPVETPDGETTEAASATATSSANAAEASSSSAPAAGSSNNDSSTAKDDGMEVDEPTVSPTAIWEAQREELQKLRDAAKPELAPRALQLLDETEDLVFDLLNAFPKGVDGAKYIINSLQEAKAESPSRDTAISARLRLLSVFARQTPLLDLPVDDCKLGMEVITSLPLNEKPQPTWLAVALLAAESMLLMSYTIKETKLGEDATSEIVRTVDFGNTLQGLLSTCLSTIRDEEISRELTLACMRLMVVLTRHDPKLCSSELMTAVLATYKDPGSKLSGSYPYLAMLTRHGFDSQKTLGEVMRREIREWMSPQRNKVSDVNHFVRQLRQMAYRDSSTFISAVGEEGALVEPGPVQSVYHIRSKIDSKEELDSSDDKDATQDSAKDQKDKKDQKDSKAPLSASDPFQRSVVDAFEHQPSMDLLVSELGSTIRDIHSEEAAKRNGTAYTENVEKSYAYSGLLLSLMTEMVGSYMSAKTAFMAAVRQGGVYRVGKGKSGFAAVLADIICCVSLADVKDKGPQNAPEVRRVGLATAGMSLLIALCSNAAVTSESSEIPEDLVAVRKIVLEGVAKAVKDSNSNQYDPNQRYGRLWVLGQVIRRLLLSRQSVIPRPQDKTSLQLAKAMLEKNYVGLLTTTLADIDLNYPEVRTPIHSLLRALEYLTKVSSKWGKKDSKPSSDSDKGDEVVDDSEDSDGSELMRLSDEESEAPEMYRNSALGILGGDIDVDDEDEDDMDDSDMDDDELMDAFQDEMDHEMEEDSGTEPSDEDGDDEEDEDSDMEGVWSTDDEEEAVEEGDDGPVIDVGAELDEIDEEGVPWEEDDGVMDEGEEEYDSEEDPFMHAEPFGDGIDDFDPEEEELEDFEIDDGFDTLDVNNTSSMHPNANLGEGNGHWGWRGMTAGQPDSSSRSRSLDMDAAATSLLGLPPRSNPADSTSHPLLQTPRGNGVSGRSTNNPFGTLSSIQELMASIDHLGGPQAVQFLENIVQQSRNTGAETIRVDLAHRNDGGFGLTIGGRSFVVAPPTRKLPSTAVELQAEYEPRPTMQRWQEEAQLFPYTAPEQLARLTVHLINHLLPAARKAAEEEAERLRKEEEADAEKRRQEAAEAEKAAAKQREEDTSEAANVALPESRPGTAIDDALEDDVDMAGTDDSDRETDPDLDEDMSDNEDEDEDIVDETVDRVLIMIDGEEVDITDTGIDLEFLQALPEDMRAEVVEQHLREQSRMTRAPVPNMPDAAASIEADFLNALPPEIRAEVIMQETLEAARRNEQPSEPTQSTEPRATGSSQPPATWVDLENEVRGLLRGADLRDMLARTVGIPPGMRVPPTPAKKAEVTGKASIEKRPLQLLDKPGVASLVRLLFFPASTFKEAILLRTLVNLCENAETRSDLLSLLLSIVQDGTGDLPAVDRSFQQMSLRGLTSTPKSTATPKGKAVETPAVSTAAGAGASALFAHLQADHVPTFIAQRCFEALAYIVNANRQTVSYFLTEHELPVGLKKGGKKGKGKEKFLPQKQHPIVVLMGLLDRTELLKAPGMMESLTGLLASITKPFSALHNFSERAKAQAEEQPEITVEELPDQPATAAADSGSTSVPSTTVVATTGASTAKDAAAVSGDAQQWVVEGQMFPPSVLRLVINCLTVGDCTSRTFSQTLNVIQNLSCIPESKRVLVQELCTRSQQLGGVVQEELKELTTMLGDVEHDISSTALAKFAPAWSSQAQLLRLLKTIDFLHSRKTTSDPPKNPGELSADEKIARELYWSLDFGGMWSQLSDALTLAEERGSTDQIAAVLLPLVEALMVVCKYTHPRTPEDRLLSPTLSATTATTPPPNNLFLSFTTEHRKVLNAVVRNNPSLMSGAFQLLVVNPRVLDFDNKRNWFFQKLKRRKDHLSYATIHLSVRRQYVFQDSYSALLHRPGEELKYGKINVKFINEDGVDAGGVTREWYHVLATQIFDPNFALFEPCAADKQTYQPNKHSNINGDHLSFFKFIGRLIGKAIFDGRLLDAYFNRAFYKQILGRPVDIRDLESIDPEYHKSLQWMLDNDITDVIDQEFTIEDDNFGAKQIVELKPGGSQIPVTEENKAEYVRLVCAYRLENSIKEQMNAFLTGFYDIIPRALIQIFEPDQLELLISGMTTIDVDELKNSTQMQGWKSSDPEVSWFWRALRSFSQEERARFMIFVTASSRVPLGGFTQLQGASGIQPFQLQRLYGKDGILPQASTCFNLLLLPKYESYEHLRERLLFAVTETSGFGKA